MKTTILKYIIVSGWVLFLVACSTKRNNFVSRNSHALSTKYNILYNGGVALDKGVAELKSQYNDNFWEMLPVERMQVLEPEISGKEKKNANFERSETKATKAIQKHSMYIEGNEKNPQMDEAYLMLGKTRYYDQRFVPALEAFNYVLYKYPTSDKIQEVKIWREKTNMRMDNDAVAVNNLRKLLKETKFKDQVFADANATLAQAFINLKEKDSAVAKLKLAYNFTKLNEEKSRYLFILGQLYDQMNLKDSAYVAYQKIIDMKRSAAKPYTIQAHARQAQHFDFAKGDTLAFVEKYNDLLKDRENRPYLDVLNHQMALFYDKQKNSKNAKKYYNVSLKKRSQDAYLIASNYRNLAEIYFNSAKYVTAGKYYDSTMTFLNNRTREYKLIAKKRSNLDDVIKFEGIAQRNDSILKLTAMTGADREHYFKNYIEALQKEEAKQKAAEAKEAKENKVALDGEGKGESKDGKESKGVKSTAPAANAPTGITGDFYFYNPKTVAFGKTEFAKKWGGRGHMENWRLVNNKIENGPKDPGADAAGLNGDLGKEPENKGKANEGAPKEDDKYTTNFYLKQLPTSQKVLDSLAKERNFAYFQLGTIYKEKFKEYQRAVDKLEKLLANNPEERLVLPAMYNLYKLYEILDKNKATAMKARILAEFPDSRYAQILSNPNAEMQLSSKPEEAYTQLYADYEKGMYREVLEKTDGAIEQFAGEELLSKFELLKAHLIGKLKGVAEYKKSLNYVALTYPNSVEGKETEKFIAERLPQLEALAFNTETPTNWKIVFKANNLEDKETKKLLEKITKFAKERTVEKLFVSTDIYTLTDNFFVIHGIKTLESAKQTAQVLRDFKDYKIVQPAIIISSENYKVVQVKKNIDDYVAGNWPDKPITLVSKKMPVVTADTNAKGQEGKMGVDGVKRDAKGNPILTGGSNPKEASGALPNTPKNTLPTKGKDIDAINNINSEDSPSPIMPPSEPRKP